jgi:hypothetical protein
VARNAIDQQPRATLPNPVSQLSAEPRLLISFSLVAGQRIVEPDHAPDHEAPVGYVVRVAGGPPFQDAVDKQRPNLELIFARQRTRLITSF